MTQQYTKTNLSINGQFVLADTANLSQDAIQRAILSLNTSNPYDYTPSSLKSTLSINYVIETQSDPNYTIVSNWKSNTTSSPTAVINLGDVIVTGYLSSYSLNLNPQRRVEAKASYEIYTPLTGNFTSQNSTDYLLYNTTNGSGVANYFSAYFYIDDTQATDTTIVSFSYDFSFALAPIYTLGSPFPSQIMALNALEKIETVSETQINSNFSGNHFNSFFNQVNNLRISNIASTWGGFSNQITFPLSGMVIQANKVDISVNDIILFNSSFNMSY